MIENLAQAKNIQQTRFNNKKTGYASAVLRFLKRNHPDNYQTIKSSLPLNIPPNWIKKPRTI